MALLAGGASAQLTRAVGTAGAVQGFQADGELAGARLAASLPFSAGMQAGDGGGQVAQATTGITGNLAAAENADALNAEGVVRIFGEISALEAGADTFSAVALKVTTGDMAAAETGSDQLYFEGVVRAQGALAALETGSDAFSAAGAAAVIGALAATESGGDGFSAVGVAVVQGAVIAIETGADALAATGSVSTTTAEGSMAATETGPDPLVAEGVVLVRGELSAAETGSDAFSGAGGALIKGIMSAAEAGADSLAAQGEVGYGAPPSAIWAYTLSNGLSAGETMVQLHAMVRELYQLHGLESGSPLTVSQTQRTVAAIVQSIEEISGTVTVTRQ